MRLIGPDQDPTRDPQLSETWAALGHLLAAADEPLDQDRLTREVLARVERRARRRRLHFVAVGLATAASLVVVGSLAWVNRVSQVVQVAAAPTHPAPAVDSPLATAEQPQIASGVEAQNLSVPATASATSLESSVATVGAWEDELASDTASLAEEMQTVEQNWQQQPDSITLLQTQIDSLEAEMNDTTL